MTSTSAAPDASRMPLSVRDARKRFGATAALDGTSLALAGGELLGLLGPNGAGKTTLINAIAGRLQLDAGQVELFGRTLDRGAPRPELGVVPQELAIYPRLTSRENLAAFGALYGVAGTALRHRVDWALEWSDLKDRADEPVRRFSGGMKRRLNIACGLLHEPSVVLLDEPTVGVDPQSRERIYEMLTSLRDAGVSILLTTHHLEEAEQRCERIVIIDHGRIIADGTLAQLIATTLGGGRTVEVALASPWPNGVPVPAGLEIGADGRSLRAHRGGLRDVFIGLTGRELRE